MRKPRTLGLASFLVVSLLAFCPEPARAGFITYNVSIDASTLNGQSGYLDFEFNPGGAGAGSATAAVADFSPGGNLLPSAPLNSVSGDVTGSLPGTLTLGNSTAFNDYFEGFTYDTTISFDVTLSGPAVGGPGGTVGSSFAFSLYDSTGTMPLLTTDRNGSVATLDLNPDGSTTGLTFPATPGGSPAATVTPLAPPAVPEPSTLSLALLGGAGGCLLRRRIRGQKTVQ
jgi:hypothetical protein